MGTGLDGGLDGGSPATGGAPATPSGPFVSRPPVPDSYFAGLVAQMDGAVQAIVGDGLVTYQPLAGPAVAVPGTFDAAFMLATTSQDGASVETVTPVVFLQLRDLPSDPMIDTPTITVRGIVYNVWKRIPDDMGSIVLALRQVR